MDFESHQPFHSIFPNKISCFYVVTIIVRGWVAHPSRPSQLPSPRRTRLSAASLGAMEHLQEAVGLATRAAVDSWKIYGKSKQKLEISQKQQSGIAEWKN